MSKIITRDFISINVKEPGTVGRGTVCVAKRHIQDRTFFEYRNKGYALLHRPATSGSDVQPVVLEFFSDLAAYHRPEHVYEVVLRRAYNVRSFMTMIGIGADPHEPFRGIDDLLDQREYTLSLKGTEAAELPNAFRTGGSPHGRRGIAPYRTDCVGINAQASCLITSMDELTADRLIEHHNQAHFLHFVTTRTKDAAHSQLWAPFFGRPVYLYIGVATLPTKDQFALASSLGFRLLVKRGLHYSMLRQLP